MRAVFFDRDNTLNETIFDTNRQVERPPWKVSELKLKPFVIESLRRLHEHYCLFLVTNQPDYVAGRVSLGALMEIKYHLMNLMLLNGVHFRCYYYCFHHPSKEICECRKPSPYFLLKACEEYHIDLKNSWMVGDRDIDIICGKRAGTKTIQICDENCISIADYRVNNIKEAVDIILGELPTAKAVLAYGNKNP